LFPQVLHAAMVSGQSPTGMARYFKLAP
jgi:hypothetical protein